VTATITVAVTSSLSAAAMPHTILRVISLRIGFLRAGLLIALVSLVSGCVAASPHYSPPTLIFRPCRQCAPAVSITQMPFQAAAPCTGAFIAHDLEHTTTAALPVPRLFDSNGSGLAINDLDGDGDQDIVLADLAGPLSILWNEGDLQFSRQELATVRKARAVALVDVDGDARLDIVLTTGNAAPARFRNLGEREFRLTPLLGVNQPAYAMNWADLDADGDLDLVTGAYDAGRQMETGSNYLFAAGAGVNVYTQGSEAWARQQLTDTAQALAISLWDLNGDVRPDVWVGNDFDAYDQVWLQRTPAPGSLRRFSRIPRTVR
jgi:hypothetical protein